MAHEGEGAYRGELQARWRLIFFRSFRLQNYSLFSHFKNDGATVEYPDPASNSMLLELKRGGREDVGEG